MTSILDNCAGVARETFAPGTVLLAEGETSGRLYILAEGSVEVLRGDTQVALVGEAGSVFGEMSVLLNRPHTATVRAAISGRRVRVRGRRELPQVKSRDRVLLGRLLAERLNAATTYLVDLKRQFEGHGNHLGMVGEVLETLIHQQHEDFTHGPES